MAQYIDKAALVAEIRRRISNLDKLGNRLYIETNFPEQYRLIHGYESVLSFIDTLEVKEVDLEKEIDLAEDKYHGFESLSRADVIEIIKYFFELGLKAQKGEEV